MRPTPELYEMMSDCPVGPAETMLSPEAPLLLRPRQPGIKPQDIPSDEYRVLAPEKVLQLFQTAMKEHSSPCGGLLIWDKTVELKWGFCWSMGLKCDSCSFRTGPSKLYYEVVTGGRGRRAASANLGLHVGLSHNMISNTGIRQILMSTNITPPNQSSMQQSANRVGEAITSLNLSDMQQQRQTIETVQQLRGTPKRPIPVEGDGRYNNALWSGGGKTPYQPATQIVYTMSENVTMKKKIIGVYTGNKLCHRANLMRSKGRDVTCPDHEGVCTANLQESDVIGDEERAVRSIVHDISNEVTVGAITTDGDSRAYKACVNSGTDVLALRDTRHFGQTLKKQVENAMFSENMFPGNTKVERTALHKRFAVEITKRCNAEFAGCYKRNRGDVNKVINKLSYVKECIVSCYSGDCSLCETHSLVCKGNSLKYLLPPATRLNLTSGDQTLLNQCLDYRLGRKGVLLTQLNSNTQKSESVNRTYQKTNPKSVTWTRNFSPRVHSGIHLRNNGLQRSTVAKMQAVGITTTPSVLDHLAKDEKNSQLRVALKATAEYKRRASQRVTAKYRRYDANKSARTVKYKKDIAMPKLKSYHNYCK